MTEMSIKLIRSNPNYGKSADLLRAGVEMKDMLFGATTLQYYYMTIL